MSLQNLRNIAIIAHVDHGKTTLVDKLLRQSQTLDARENLGERVMDSNDLERERGITILSKNTAIRWRDARTDIEYRINIVDTPGHADFGGEVERVLSMVDCVCLLVDAADGPMPQTRFVTQKAFGMGLNPIVVVNKIDRPGARAHWVIDQVFDLFDKLGATDKQLDFPIVYASALNGYAGDNPDIREGNMDPLFQTIVDQVAPPKVNSDGPFQMQVTSLAYSSYVGVIGTGRITRGKVKPNQQVSVVGRDGAVRTGKVLQVLGFMGLDKIEVPEAEAGDIVAITGIADLGISETICDLKNPEQLATLQVD
ncbi:MAG TPA: GTP-binding protein, partial [Nevskia sp.]|nr:GTP-binding protein [Nevskia sp.]